MRRTIRTDALLLAAALLAAAAALPRAGGAGQDAARAGHDTSAPGDFAPRTSARPRPVPTADFSGATLTVGGSGGHGSIAAALRDARDGDRVIVLPGTWHEGPLVIDRRIELVGRGGATVDGGGAGHVLQVTADGVVIRGLTITGSGFSFVHDFAAIIFEGVSGCTAEDNRLEGNFFGIYIAKSNGCRIAGNVIVATEARESASGNGIHLWSASDAEVESNHVAGHRDGIYLEHVRGAAIRGNTSEQNLRYGLHFMFSSENEYIGNTFRSNGAGVAVMYSRGVRILENVFEDNWGPTAYGLLAKEISDSRIAGNRFTRNTVGLSSEGSQRVVVEHNRFEANGWAARVMANSTENRFTANDFIENSFDVTTNSRQNFNTFEGNYWSRYGGYDLDGDGIGDIPFRPVRLFSLLVERTPVALALLRSAFVDLLDVAERVAPVLTPEALVDQRPSIRPVAGQHATETMP